MGTSIKLGNDTYLDSSGVVIDSLGSLLSSVGNMTEFNSSGSISVPSSSTDLTLITSYTIPKGAYIVETFIRFSSNSSGVRYLTVSFNEGAEGTAARSHYVNPVSGNNTSVKDVTTVNVTNNAGSTVYIYARQSSGSTLSVIARCKITRIG